MKLLTAILALLFTLPALAANRTPATINIEIVPIVQDGPANDTINVSAPDATAPTGSTVTIPIHATSLSAVYGIDMSVQYDPAVLNAFDVLPGDVTSGMILVSNTRIAGAVHTAQYGIDPTSGDGDLFSIRFQVVGDVGAETDLTITRCSFDEGRLPCHTAVGHVIVGD
jgi:hypothetical protein